MTELLNTASTVLPLFIKLAQDIITYMFMTPGEIFQSMGIDNTIIAKVIEWLIGLIPGDPLTIIEIMLSIIGIYFVVTIVKYFINIIN